jgi:hypothetical protein
MVEVDSGTLVWWEVKQLFVVGVVLKVRDFVAANPFDDRHCSGGFARASATRDADCKRDVRAALVAHHQFSLQKSLHRRMQAD